MAVFSKFAVSVVAVAVGYEGEHCETASALRVDKLGNGSPPTAGSFGNRVLDSSANKAGFPGGQDDPTVFNQHGLQRFLQNNSAKPKIKEYEQAIAVTKSSANISNKIVAPRGKKLDAGSLVTLIRDKKNFNLAEAVLSKESEILKLDAGSLVRLIRDKKNFKPLAEAVLSKESEILEQFGGRRLGQEAEFAAHVSSLLQKADPKTLEAYCDKFEKQFNLVMEEPENKKCNLDEVLLKMQKKMQQESFCEMKSLSEMKKNLPEGVIKYAEALAEAHRQKENKELLDTVTQAGGYICLGILGLLALVCFCALLLVSIGTAESDDSDY